MTARKKTRRKVDTINRNAQKQLDAITPKPKPKPKPKKRRRTKSPRIKSSGGITHWAK